MTGIIILLVVMTITFMLGRYAITEGQRIERQKKFMKDMEKWEKEKMVNPAVNSVPTINKNFILDDGVCEGEYVHPNERKK
jgi:hypothetical protein